MSVRKETMKNLLIASLLICVLSAQERDFQNGRIISVEKIGPNAAPGHTATPNAENRQAFNLTIELGGASYVCRAETGTELDPNWTKGKEVPVKLHGKTMLVKRVNGRVVKLAIVSPRNP